MKLDFSHVDLSQGLSQFKSALSILLSTPKFIMNHALWKGFLDHKWVLIFSIIVAIFFSFTLYKDIHNYFSPSIKDSMNIEVPTEDLENAMDIIEDVSEDIPLEGQAELGNAKDSLKKVKEKLEDNHKPLFSGSLKFLLLIFLEVFIFHFSVKTNNILKEENKTLVFKDFFKAQKRMILVMGRKWLYGLLMYILISVVCGIAGVNFLRDTIMFLIYGFYLGFAFLDNYLEQYGFTIKNSVKCVQKHFGASALFGVVASLLMNIPLIGPLIVPLVFGIAATRYGHSVKMQAFVPISKKESSLA